MKSLKKILLIELLFIFSITGMAQNQNALHFDGTNDKVDLPAGTHANMTTNGTLETWIKTSANNSGYRGIVVRSNYYGLFLIDNKLSTYVWGGGSPGPISYNNVSLNDGAWHHVALSFQVGVTNGTQMYLDGQPVGPAITLTTLSATNNFQIGCNTNVQFFNGQIDNVKIYSRSLAASEIYDSYRCFPVNNSGLDESYKFNQGVTAGNNSTLTSLISQTGLNNGTLSNFALTGSVSNWVTGFICCFTSEEIIGRTQYCIGETLNLNAEHTVDAGQTITSYQWKKDGVNIVNGGDISGANSANLQIANIVLGDLGLYSVEVTATCGVSSSAVNVTQSTGSINISNLKAHYPLNNSTSDVSGNNYSGNPYGGLSSTANRFGQANSAYSFDGLSSEVRIAAPNGQTILGNGQNKSISLYFKRRSSSSKGMLLSYQDATPVSWNPLAYIGNDGVLRGWMFQNGTAPWSSGITIDTNWHHLTMLYTTNVQTIYLDGSQVATLSGNIASGSSNIIKIGNGYANTTIPGITTTGNQPFDGLIDEVRFYNSVLSLTDINILKNSPFLITNQPQAVGCIQIGSTASLSISVSGSVTYQWQKNGVNIPGATSSNYNISNFQQSDFGLYRCVVTAICDNTISSVSNHVSLGVITIPQPSRVYTFDNHNDDHLLRGAYHSVLNNSSVNSPATFVADRFGVANSAHFRGTSTSVSLNKTLNLPDMTISMWIYLNSTGSHYFLSPINNALPYHLSAQGNQLRMTLASGSIINIPYTLQTTQWVQITMVYQGNTNIVYANGQHVFTTNSGINLSTNPIGTIAGLASTANTASYTLDDVFVFDQALSASQVLSFYADGGKAPYFYIEPINDMVCESNAIRFNFQSAVPGSAVSVKKNGVDISADGNVVITDNSVVISNPSASDFTNYTITLRNGCGSVSKTVNAVQLASDYTTQGLVRYFPFNNNVNDAMGGPALSAGGIVNYTTDRFGNANSAYQQTSGGSLLLPTNASVTNFPFTICFWMNNYPTNTSHQLLSSGQTSYLGLNAQNQYLGFSLGVNIEGFKHYNVFTGGWRMITMTFDGQIVKIYSNNQLISVHRPLATTHIQNFINGLQSDIDDIRIYNRVLAEEEICGLYTISNIATQPQNQSVCVGQTANLSVTAQSFGGNTLSYQWSFNGNILYNGNGITGVTSNNLQISNAQSSQAGSYTCLISAGCNSSTSTTASLTVGAMNITQQPQNSSVCQGSSASFSIATQGATVTYQWKKNGVNIGGATNAALNLTNVNSSDAGNYTVDIIGGSCGTIISQVATLTVQSLPTATISPTSPTICQGQSINLTAGGGTSFSWDNGLGISNIITVSPTTTTAYNLLVTGSNGCTATASQTVIVVNTNTPTGIANQTFCNSATVTNLTTTSGTGIQWYSTSNGGTALSAGTALTNGETYFATQTVNTCESVNRLAVVVTINAPNAPTGVSNQTVCNGAVLEDLSVTGLNTKWYTNANGGSPIVSSTLLNNGTIYYASQTINSCESATRLVVTVAFGIPSAPTGSASQTICNSGTVANLVASGPNILWYATETGGSALSSGTALVNGTTYYASQTPGGCESTDRFAVLVTINVPASPTGTASQTFCNSAMVSNLAATGSGIQWYAASTGGSALTTGTALATGTTYYASQTISGCESTNRLAVTATINNFPVNITGTTVYCQGQTMNLTASFLVNSGESITGYQWKKNGVNLTNGGNISGATSANLLVANIVSSDFDTYSVDVTSTCGVGFNSENITESGIIDISNLTAYYPFNNGSSDDSSGNNYNATGSAITSVNNRLNQANSAVSFNGSSSTVTIAAPTGQTILGNGQNKSISLWFKRSSLTSKGILVSYQQASPGNWNPLAYIGSDGILRGWMYQGGVAAWSSNVTIDTNWHHLALIYTTNKQTAYLDGSQVATMNGTLSPGASNIIKIGNGYANTGIVGISTTGNQPFSGLIDEVRFYNAVLTIAEINELRTSPFLITTQPQSQRVCVGETANLSLNVLTPNVSSTFTYQWTFNGTPLSNGGSTSGANTNNLQISNAQVANVGTYNCILSPGCNEATSTSVTLTVDTVNANVTQTGSTLTAAQSGANYTWVDCNDGNQPIAGANGQSFTPTANGSYAVEIVLNGCTAISSCVQIGSVGLEEDKLDWLTIQPNPTSGMLIITVSKPTNTVVSAANGTVITTLKLEGETVLDATKFATGVYYLRTTEGQTVKFIKQ